MKQQLTYRTVFGLLLLLSGISARAQSADHPATTDIKIDLPQLGAIKPRSVTDIESSNWLIGCETLDRDMADYEQYKTYLAPLGIKRIRLQAGWAKTEKVQGQYDWAWLDRIINDAVQRGLQPWLETSYGNPVYPGGGGINLSAGLPTSPEALKAWDRWVEALVKRYKDKVKEWEVWNEPNFGDNTINTPEMVADLNIRTADIIKRIQPEAKISGLSMGHIDLDYADAFFKILHQKDKMGLFDNMTYHDYFYNPDANYGHVAELRQVLDKYAPNVKLRQGENGSPSFGGFGRGALGDYNWSELTQAKWNTRRMLGDLGHDIECSILGIIDMNYASAGSPITKLNVKGIIESDSTKRAIRPKMAYYAMQHVASVFDNSLKRIKSLKPTHNVKAPTAPGEVKYNKSTDRSLAVYGYEHKQSKKQVYSIWMNECIPAESNQTKPVTVTFLNGNFDKPVYVDIITGRVYDIPATDWSKTGTTYTFKNIPVYDAPILIADASIIPTSK
ncbi:putative exported protein [Fibrisoma limi BUZ 3]|uniref:Putative exported protein n=1 Tax=Fibrisoma limi BUZ 3 TaxID=1185876 RepID=I2GHS9_9BACT|nr:beta-galactosidase [Fibrisoma limi]CCH53454.1 putative exported protein [Fibrisoma limi BUZ 3]